MKADREPDIIMFVGIVVAAVGLWWVWPALAVVAAGLVVILLAFALAADRARRAETKDGEKP